MAQLFKRKLGNGPVLPHSHDLVIDGITVEVGQMVRIDGEDGVFKFKWVYGPDGSVTVWGGATGHEQFRSFPLTKVRLQKAPRKKPIYTEAQLEALRERAAKAREAAALKKQQQ